MKREYVCTKYESKWLCPPSNDSLDCEDCVYSKLVFSHD